MRKTYKIINIVLIFTLIGMAGRSDIAFSNDTLRVPLRFNTLSKELTYGKTPIIESAIKEGRLFVLEDFMSQQILDIIYGGTLEEVTSLFCQSLGQIDIESKANLMNNLKSKGLRSELYKAFVNVRDRTIGEDEFRNRKFGIILEKEGEATLFEDVFYCNAEEINTKDRKISSIYLGLNVIKEARLNPTSFWLLMRHKARDAARGKHIDPIEEAKQGLITEDEKDLIYEFFDEITDKKFRDVTARSQNINIKKTLSTDETEKILMEIFDLRKATYAMGPFKIKYDRFSPGGTVNIRNTAYPYFSMREREYFYRVGGIFVIDSNYRDCLPKSLSNTDAKFIFLDFREEKISYGIKPWVGDDRFGTVGLLLALQSMNLTDKTIVDAGCGNGVLAIAAALLGAKKVILLEGVRKYEKLVRDNASVNGVLDKMDFKYFGPSIEKLYEEFKQKGKKENADIILSNIPFWGLPFEEEYGKKYNSDLILILLSMFPSDLYIASGCDYGYLGGNRESAKKIFNREGLSIKEIIELQDIIGLVKPTIISSTQRSNEDPVIFQGTFAPTIAARLKEQKNDRNKIAVEL